MKITGVHQFADFVSSTGLKNIDSMFMQTYNCSQNHKASCNCHGRENKATLYERCNKLYAESVKFIVPKLENEIFTKIQDRNISFYDDAGNLLKLISR